MDHNDDIPPTDTTEIKQPINRVKQGKLDQGDTLLIERPLNFPLTIVSLVERKHTSIRRMKELPFGMKEKKRGKGEAKNRAELFSHLHQLSDLRQNQRTHNDGWRRFGAWSSDVVPGLLFFMPVCFVS